MAASSLPTGDERSPADSTAEKPRVSPCDSQLAYKDRGGSVTAHCPAAAAQLTREYQSDHRRLALTRASLPASWLAGRPAQSSPDLLTKALHIRGLIGSQEKGRRRRGRSPMPPASGGLGHQPDGVTVTPAIAVTNPVAGDQPLAWLERGLAGALPARSNISIAGIFVRIAQWKAQRPLSESDPSLRLAWDKRPVANAALVKP